MDGKYFLYINIRIFFNQERYIPNMNFFDTNLKQLDFKVIKGWKKKSKVDHLESNHSQEFLMESNTNIERFTHSQELPTDSTLNSPNIKANQRLIFLPTFPSLTRSEKHPLPNSKNYYNTKSYLLNHYHHQSTYNVIFSGHRPCPRQCFFQQFSQQ